MAEQRPFKPFVESSSLSALTKTATEKVAVFVMCLYLFLLLAKITMRNQRAVCTVRFARVADFPAKADDI